MAINFLDAVNNANFNFEIAQCQQNETFSYSRDYIELIKKQLERFCKVGKQHPNLNRDFYRHSFTSHIQNDLLRTTVTQIFDQIAQKNKLETFGFTERELLLEDVQNIVNITRMRREFTFEIDLQERFEENLNSLIQALFKKNELDAVGKALSLITSKTLKEVVFRQLITARTKVVFQSNVNFW